MDVKERWNEDGNIKKNVKIVKNLKIVKKEKMMICARGSGLQGTEEMEALKNRKLIVSCQPWWKKRDTVVGMHRVTEACWKR
ncbi:hypothetical protein [Microbacterium sp. SLBN-1]